MPARSRAGITNIKTSVFNNYPFVSSLKQFKYNQKIFQITV